MSHAVADEIAGQSIAHFSVLDMATDKERQALK